MGATILTSFLSFLLLYRYVAIFLVSFGTALILPLPAATTLAAAGAFSFQGYFNIYWVLLIGLLSNVAGDMAGYLLARHYGEETLKKIGFGRLIRHKNYQIFKDYLFDFRGSVIYFSRFYAEIGPMVNILSGLAKIPMKTFLILDILGEGSYVLLYAGVGYLLGTQWENNLGFFASSGLVIFSLGLVIMVTQVVLFRRRRKKKDRPLS